MDLVPSCWAGQGPFHLLALFFPLLAAAAAVAQLEDDGSAKSVEPSGLALEADCLEGVVVVRGHL